MDVDRGACLLDRVGPAVWPSPGPFVAFIGDETTAERLAGSVAVGMLVPHDRDVHPRRWSEAPLGLVIQSSCGWCAGPWRHLGSPHAPDRAVTLARLVAAARSRGIPVALWRDGPLWQYAHAGADLGPLPECGGVAEVVAALGLAVERRAS